MRIPDIMVIGMTLTRAKHAKIFMVAAGLRR